MSGVGSVVLYFRIILYYIPGSAKVGAGLESRRGGVQVYLARWSVEHI